MNIGFCLFWLGFLAVWLFGLFCCCCFSFVVVGFGGFVFVFGGFFCFCFSKIVHGTLPQSLSYSILQSSHLSPCHMCHRISLRSHALRIHSCFQERDTIKQEYMPLRKEIALFVRTVESSNFTQRSTLRLF